MFEHPPKTSGLDAIRGIMAVVVCFSHALLLLAGAEGTLSSVAAIAARLAVLTFFVISGYVISLSIQRNAERNRSFSLVEYANSRIFRILPPLIVAYSLMLLLCVTAAILGVSRAPLRLPATATSYSFDFGAVAYAFVTLAARGGLGAGLNDPLWTLQDEIQLYVIAALLVLAVERRKGWPLGLAGLYALLCFRPWYDGHLTAHAAFYLAFAAGWLVQRLEIKRRHLVSALVLLPAGWVFLSEPPLATASVLSSNSLAVLAQVCYAIAFACVVVDVGKWRTPLSATGNFSYTLYIIHFPIFLFLAYLWLNWFGAYPGTALALVSVVAVVAISALLAKFAERSSTQRRAFRAFVQTVRATAARRRSFRAKS